APLADALPPTADGPLTDAPPPTSDDVPVEWSPPEPAPKKRRLGLWIGIGVAAAALAAAGVSTILIAPGTTVAGIPVGGMTQGAAAEAISSQIAQTEVHLTGDDDATLSGASLGAQIEAQALAAQAFSDRPMWKIGSWMGDAIPATVTLDPQTAESALRAAVPSGYTDAVDATVAFDSAKNAYVSTPAQPGTGVDLPALTSAFDSAVAKNEKAFDFTVTPAETPAAITTEDAAALTEKLNAMLGTVGFYVGTERTVPVAAATAASWLTVQDVEGTLQVTADPQAIQKVVATLPGAVNREPVNAVNVVDSGGDVLREITAGVTGRVVGDTSKVADAFAAQLAEGKGQYALGVTETPFESTNLFRRIEVDLGAQMTYLFENEQVVRSWAISSGMDATPTHQGEFRVYAHVEIQDMKGENADGTPYVTEDVPWVTYFNGDEAFHGTYWHENFGNQMSHGCVNMPIGAAEYLYNWAPTGLEVWVHG
ncbi:MAG: L,D-transpeptidase family protein, partial [Microbacterium sp.]